MAMLSLTHEHYDPAHLDAVRAEMRTLGSPIIRAIDMGDYYQLIEGCHRARAAADLGIPVTLDIIDVSECFDVDGYPTELGEGPIRLVPGCEEVDLDGASVSDLTRSVGHLVECEVIR